MRKSIKLFLFGFIFALAAIFSCGLVFGNIQTASANGGIYVEDGADVEINGGIMNNNSEKALYFKNGNHTVKNLTITGSSNGAIYVEAGNVTIDNCHFENNTNKNGGAIYVGANATLTVLNSTLYYNSSTENGGAIYLAEGATLNMQGTILANNTSTINGGAIYLAKGADVTVDSSEFVYNTSANGAAIATVDDSDAVDFNTISISNSIIANNRTNDESTDENGIILLSDYSVLTMDNTEVKRNESVGGILLQSGLNATSSITNSEFVNNTAAATITGNSVITIDACEINENTNTMAVLLVAQTTLTIKNTTIENNSVNNQDETGGIIFVGSDDSAVLSNLVIEDVSINGNNGAAILAKNTNMTLKGDIIVNGNTSLSGAGMALLDSTINVENGCVISITNNMATAIDENGVNGWGAGILLMETGSGSKTYDFKGAIVKGNSASHCGGGIAIFDMSPASRDIVVKNVTLEGNSAADGAGVVVAQIGLAAYELENVVIKDNNGTNGAGIYHNGRSGLQLTLSGTTKIVDNIATGNGGAIYYNANVDIVYNGVEISGNTAENGGAIYFDYQGDDALTLTGLNISNNTATNGGGLYITNTAAITISNCQFTNNTAIYGGGLYVANDNVTIADCVIDSNTADYGGGIYVNGDTTFAGSTSITNNIAHIIGGGIGINEDVTVTVNNIEIVGNKVLPASMVDEGTVQTVTENAEGNSFIAALTMKEGNGTISLALISVLIVTLLAVVLQKQGILKKIKK